VVSVEAPELSVFSVTLASISSSRARARQPIGILIPLFTPILRPRSSGRSAQAFSASNTGI